MLIGVRVSYVHGKYVWVGLDDKPKENDVYPKYKALVALVETWERTKAWSFYSIPKFS